MIPELSDCKPGVVATGHRIVVCPEPVETKTKGGIFLPDEHKDRERMVAVRARLVSVGPVAFDYANFPDGSEPKEGDAIMIARLAGYMFQGADGRDYRILDDKDINAIIDEGAFA